MVLVSSISNFFINKNSQRREMCCEKKYLLAWIWLYHWLRNLLWIHQIQNLSLFLVGKLLKSGKKCPVSRIVLSFHCLDELVERTQNFWNSQRSSKNYLLITGTTFFTEGQNNFRDKIAILYKSNIKNGRLIGNHYTRRKKGYNSPNHQQKQLERVIQWVMTF